MPAQDKWTEHFEFLPALDTNQEASLMEQAKIAGLKAEQQALREYQEEGGRSNIELQCEEYGVHGLSVFGKFNIHGKGNVAFLLDTTAQFYHRFHHALHLMQKKGEVFEGFSNPFSKDDPQSMVYTLVAKNEKTAHALFLLVQLVSAPIMLNGKGRVLQGFSKKCGLRQGFSTVTAEQIAAHHDVIQQLNDTSLPFIAEALDIVEEYWGTSATNKEDESVMPSTPIATTSAIYAADYESSSPSFVKAALHRKFFRTSSVRSGSESDDEASEGYRGSGSVSPISDTGSMNSYGSDHIEMVKESEKVLAAYRAVHAQLLERVRANCAELDAYDGDLLEGSELRSSLHQTGCALYSRRSSMGATHDSQLTVAPE